VAKPQSSQVIVIDHGADAMERMLRESAGLFVEVGIFGGRVGRAKGIRGLGKAIAAQASANIAAYALYNELGAPKANIPERSFFRSTQAEKRDEHEALIKRGLDAAVAGNGTVIS